MGLGEHGWLGPAWPAPRSGPAQLGSGEPSTSSCARGSATWVQRGRARGTSAGGGAVGEARGRTGARYVERIWSETVAWHWSSTRRGWARVAATSAVAGVAIAGDSVAGGLCDRRRPWPGEHALSARG
jgi:hypothetical protein